MCDLLQEEELEDDVALSICCMRAVAQGICQLSCKLCWAGVVLLLLLTQLNSCLHWGLVRPSASHSRMQVP